MIQTNLVKIHPNGHNVITLVKLLYDLYNKKASTFQLVCRVDEKKKCNLYGNL